METGAEGQRKINRDTIGRQTKKDRVTEIER